jgi:tRNA (Thr-GGU) A37 N-methylase
MPPWPYPWLDRARRDELLAIDGLRIQVSDPETLDRTPILDIKPVIDTVAER